jgi:hypothetical protein
VIADRRDLALAEGTVERAVDHLRRDSQTRRRVAVDHQPGLQAAILLIRIHVGQQRQFAELLQHSLRPIVQLLQVITLQRVLVGGVAHAAAHADVLHGLQEEGRPRHLCELGAKPPDHLGGGELAFSDRLQRDEDASGVGGPALSAGESDQRVDGRVRHDDVDELRELLLE